MKLTGRKGFTLIEVLVALGILSISMSVLVSSLLKNLNNNMNSEIRYEAIQAAQSVLDDIRFQDITTLSAPLNTTVQIGQRTYAVTATYCQMPQFCISDDIKQISVSVSYKSNFIYETNTVFSKLS